MLSCSERDLINDDLNSFCSLILSANDLSCFSFCKDFVKCPSLSVNSFFDDVSYDVTPCNDVAVLGYIF